MKSALDGSLFYQLLLGEMNVQQGSPGSGFSIILDAARKTRDPALFQRAIDLALQSRSGDAALQAARVWKRELPDGTEANRYILQILLALNRVEEAGKALETSIHELPVGEQSAAIASIPRIFSRVQDKPLAADAVEKALGSALQQAPTAASAWTTVGRMRRDAGQSALALEAVRRGHAADKNAQGPLILGLSLFNEFTTELHPLLAQALQNDVQAELRLGYARQLMGRQFHSEALQQLSRLNTQNPSFADAWLVHGLLLQELNKGPHAEEKLRRYVELAPMGPNPSTQEGLTEALLALAQIAQKQGQFEKANQWLTQVPPNVAPLKLASRQADLLALQGRPQEALTLLDNVTASTPQQKVLKVLAQSQWMRKNKQAAQAHALLKKALQEHAQHDDLLSELALVAEKLKRFDEMESALVQLMKRRPEDPHAFNALGYSLADRNTRLPEARQLITQALKLAPKDAYIQDSLGWVAFRQGQHAEAVKILQAAYQSKPDAEIAAHLGEVLWVIGQHQQAADIWREGLQLDADNETLQETLQRFKFKP